MTQPNVWTLTTPFATIIALYANVPEHGRLDDNQISWLDNEFKTAAADAALRSRSITHPSPPTTITGRATTCSTCSTRRCRRANGSPT